MSNVDIAYYDTDFFYDNETLCSEDEKQCTDNKKFANELFNITKTHIVSNQRLYNIQNKYNNTILLTINLGIGILITGPVVFYYITKLK
jgi:hypothetical protein